MGIELNILGIRKIRDEEIEKLFGKTGEAIEKSQYFRTLFPKVSSGSRYRCYSKEEADQEHLRSIRHMMSPILDAHGKERYVFWVEELGYYWHKDPYGRIKIEELLFDRRVSVEWDQSFHVVPYSIISDFMDRKPLMKKKREEIIAFLYG